MKDCTYQICILSLLSPTTRVFSLKSIPETQEHSNNLSQSVLSHRTSQSVSIISQNQSVSQYYLTEYREPVSQSVLSHRVQRTSQSVSIISQSTENQSVSQYYLTGYREPVSQYYLTEYREPVSQSVLSHRVQRTNFRNVNSVGHDQHEQQHWQMSQALSM